MKTMTCKQLGGGCDKAFQGETFEEIMTQSKAHGMAMFQQQDPAHLDAIKQAQLLMIDPTAMQTWLANKKTEFDALPDQ